MVTNTSILSAGQKSQLFAIQQTSRSLVQSQNRIATGKDVNSPIDNPQNYFSALSLTSRASDLNRTLDGISKSISTLNNAESARNTLNQLISQAQSQTQDALASLQNDSEDLGNLILADDPVIYYRLNEESGTTATNLGNGGAALNGTYAGGFELNTGALTLSLDNASARFDGASGRVNISNNNLVNTDAAGYAQRTVELTFQADDLEGRQVLFEEGGTGNSASIYLDDDQLYFVARDAGDFGPFNISTTIEAGKTYQAAFVLDSDNGSFTGYLNGEEVGTGAVNRPLSRHGGAVAIGRNAGGTFFHDGANAGDGEYFQGRIADFALYNTALEQDDLRARYDVTQLEQAEVFQEEVANLLSQADLLTQDASFAGINLLNNEDLVTNFNLNGSSSLVTEGVDFTFQGLGIETPDFSNFSNINDAIVNLDDANDAIENFGTAISNDLAVINARQGFAENTINDLEAGSDDLLRADIEAEAANILAQQARQEIQLQTFALSAQGSSIADFLGRSSIF
jgi:flagellin-like hook-associated protein FlgL